jgi:hypothetical protein
MSLEKWDVLIVVAAAAGVLVLVLVFVVVAVLVVVVLALVLVVVVLVVVHCTEMLRLFLDPLVQAISSPTIPFETSWESIL